MFALRPYQREAVDAVHASWSNGVNRPAVILPTGAGKTVVFSHLVREWVGSPAGIGKRVVVLAHRKELITQAADKIRTVAPELSVGIVQGNMNQTLAQVCVTCVPTLRSQRRLQQLHNVGMVIVDECHHGTAQTYLNALRHFGSMAEGPGATPTVGFTATLVRGDGAALGDVWQDVVYSRDISEMIRDGFLVKPRGIRVKVSDFRIDKIHKQNGDLAAGEVGAALEQSMAPRAIAEAYVENAKGRQGILFAPTVSSAEVIADHLEGAGIRTAVVHGAMADKDRDEALAAFRRGEVDILCNCMVLTEGTDLPMAEVAVIARPTLNAGLYIQMVGRVLRLHEGKRDALIIDVAGATGRHSLVSPVELFGDDIEVDGENEEIDQGNDADDDERADGDGSAPPKPTVDGEIVSFEIDLFRQGGSAWSQTRAGVWFLPAGDRYMVAVHGPDRVSFDAIWMHVREVGQSGFIGRGFGNLADAMNASECNVTQQERMTASLRSPWRKREPSEKQINYARQLGIPVESSWTKGDVSDAIAVARASARIDPRVKPYMIGAQA